MATFIVTIVTLMLTNPTKEKYLEHVSWKFAAEIENNVCGLPDLVRGICKTIVRSQRPQARYLLDTYTRHTDYRILSVFDTEVLGKHYRTIGIFANFWDFEIKSEPSQ